MGKKTPLLVNKRNFHTECKSNICLYIYKLETTVDTRPLVAINNFVNTTLTVFTSRLWQMYSASYVLEFSFSLSLMVKKKKTVHVYF